jgi:hypothetical protein
MADSAALNFAKNALAAIGVLALGAVAIAAIAMYRNSGGADRRDAATGSDSLFILNWAGVPTKQNFAVSHSFQSARSFTGDHVDGYCITLENAPIDAEWRSPSALERPFLEAVTFGLDFAKRDLSCLPSSADLSNRKILIKPFSLHFNSGQPGAGEIILIDPATKELFFVSFKV